MEKNTPSFSPFRTGPNEMEMSLVSVLGINSGTSSLPLCPVGLGRLPCKVSSESAGRCQV